MDEVASILDEGAQVNARGDWGMEDGRAALHFAVAGEHVEVARLLIARGADVEIESKLKDDWGAAPIHLAAETGNSEMVELLLQHGATTEIMDNEKLRAVHVAAAHGKLDVLKVLYRYNCDLNARTGDQSTVLHYAAGFGDLETVKWLVEKGVKHDLKKRGGKLPKDLAGMFNHNEVKKYLKDPFAPAGDKSTRLSFRNSFRKKKKKKAFRPTHSEPNLHKSSEATGSLIPPTLRGSESSSEAAGAGGPQRPASQNTLTRSHSSNRNGFEDVHLPPSTLDSASSITELSAGGFPPPRPPYPQQSNFTNSRSSSRASGRHKSKRDQYEKQGQRGDNGIISNASNSRSSSRTSGRHQSKREQFEMQQQAAATSSRDHTDTLEMISSLDSINRSSYRSSGRHTNKKQQEQLAQEQATNIRVLEEANESHIRTITNIEREAQELQGRLQALTEQNHQYQMDMDRLRQREMELVAMNDAHKETIANRELEIGRLSQDFKHIAETAQKSKSAHEDRIRTLEDRIRVLEERDKTNKRELERARDDNENLSHMLQESGKTGTKALEYQEKYRTRVIELEQMEVEHQQVVTNLRKELDNTSQQLLLANQKLLANQERKNEGLQELLHQDATNNQTIAALKMEVDDLSRKLAHSDQKWINLQTQHQASLSELLEQDSRNNQTIGALRSNVETLTMKLTDAERKLATSQNREHLVEMQREVSTSQQSVNTLRGQVEFLVAKLDNCQKDQQTKESVIKQQESTINSLQQQLAMASKDLSQTTEKLASMQTAQQQILSRHKRDVDQKANERQIQQQATIQDLLYQDATKQATIDQQKKDNLELEEKLRKAQRALLDYQDEQKAKIKKLEDLEVTNRQTISSLMKEIDQLTKRIKDNTQTQQNAMLENRVKELEREAETKERALENLTANNHHLKAKFDQETDQLNFLNNRVAELQAMLTSKTVNIEVLEKDNKVFTDKLRRMESRQGEQNALETRIVDLEAETEAKRMTISALAAENKNLASRLEETDRTGSYAKQLEKELQEIRDQDQANKQTIASLKKDVEKLTRQLNDTQNNLVVSKNKLHDFDSSLRSTEEGYKQTIRSLEQKASRLQQDLHESRIDIKTHQTKLMRAENQLMEAEKLKGNKAALEKKVVKLTQELQECKQNASKPMSEDERQKAISSLNSIIGIKDTKISVLEKKLEEKENQLIESQRALEQQDLDFSTWQDNERRDHNQRITELTRRLEEATKKT